MIISGPGGAGKGTVVARLVELDPSLWLSRSWTTRPRRPGEPADAYTFVDRDTFLNRLAGGGFIEHTDFAGTGHLYGTPAFDKPDKDVVLEIELDGAQQVKRRAPEAKLILIVAPSREDREARLLARGDSEHQVRRRLDVGEKEEALGRTIADAVVVNDDVERAAGEVAGIIAGYRRERSDHRDSGSFDG